MWWRHFVSWNSLLAVCQVEVKHKPGEVAVLFMVLLGHLPGLTTWSARVREKKTEGPVGCIICMKFLRGTICFRILLPSVLWLGLTLNIPCSEGWLYTHFSTRTALNSSSSLPGLLASISWMLAYSHPFPHLAQDKSFKGENVKSKLSWNLVNVGSFEFCPGLSQYFCLVILTS